MKFSLTPTGAAALTLSVCTATSALAQSTPSLPEVVVTAIRAPQPITEVIADMTVIDREQLEAIGATTLTEVLSRMDGVQAIGFGASSRIYIRGADAYMTALYIDGVKVYSQDGTTVIGGGAPWELVPVSQIERIEVVRGPLSAVYGSDAMGGVIQIFTRRGTEKLLPYATLGLGSSNLRQATAGISASAGQFDYALNIGTESSDGYNTTPQWVHTPSQEPTANRFASARAGFNVTNEQRLELATLSSAQESRYVPWGGGVDYQTKSALTTGALKWMSTWNDVYKTALSFTQAKIAKSDDYPNDFQTVSQGVLWENALRLGKGSATIQLEQRKDGYDQQVNGSNDPAFSGTRTSQALALGYGVAMGRHTVQANLRNDRDSQFGAYQTGALAYAYAIEPRLRFTASTATAFKAPTLEQIHSQYGDLNLQPETNRSNELGLGFSQGPHKAKLVVYRNTISNMISSGMTSTNCVAGWFCYYNVNQATIEGVTLSGATRLGRFGVSGSVDVVEPRNDATGKVLSLRARQMAKFGVDTVWAQWTVGAEILDVGPRFDNASNTVSSGGYDVISLSVSRPVAKDWKLLLRVNNLLDQKYQQVDGIAAPGATVFAGIHWAPGH